MHLIQIYQGSVRFGLGREFNEFKAGTYVRLQPQLSVQDPSATNGVFGGMPTGFDAVQALHADGAELQYYLKNHIPLGSFQSLANLLFSSEAKSALEWAAFVPGSFRERLVWFWTNHFSASFPQTDAVLIGPYIREAIRANVSGLFSEMVQAAECHPAMLRYLNNADSLGPNSPYGSTSDLGLNENLGRECMELHTVGLKAGYTQADVTAMAKILTGWSVADATHRGDSTGFFFREDFHEPGPQTVMGQVFDAPGEQQGIDALKFLATRPATYDHIATKLVRHFVSDNPPPHCVAKIAGVLKDTGGHLGAASAALVDLPEAWVPLTKFKTPMELMISAIRACPPGPDDPVIDYRGTLAQLGQPLWGAPLPNGWPDQASAWDSSDQMIARVNWAYTYSARFESGPAGVQPADIAHIALGPLLRPETRRAMAQAGSRREAMTLLFTAPEFQRR